MREESSHSLTVRAFTFLLLLVFFTVDGCQLHAQSPSTLAGRTIQLNISSGSFPFASSGLYRFLPSALDSTYAIVPISGSVSASTGTHTYTKTGPNTATLSFVDAGNGTLTASCTFTTASSGSYVLTSHSFPGGSQTGTFFLYTGTSPTTVAGYTITVTITSGTFPFADSGSYRFLPAASGNTYNVVGISGVVNSSGTYSYTKNSTSTGYISYNDSVIGPGSTSQFSFESTTTGTLYLQNSSSGGYQTGVFTSAPPAAPSVAFPPLSQTVGVGGNVMFTVAATGVGTLSYQWRKNSSNIGGATGSSYTLSNAQTADAGSYDVIVSNIGGSTPSGAAMLTVVVPPSITVPPASQTVTVGQNATLSVTAAGTPPLIYQWRKAGADISGATSANLSLAGVQTNQAGNYTVVVSNVGGSVTSAPPAALTVNSAPGGPVVGWGFNGYGQTSVPFGLNGVVAIAAGLHHTVALKRDGTVVAWGSNSDGQTTVPGGLGVVAAVSAGQSHTVALKTDGTVVAWGLNGFGQTTVPVGLTGVVSIAAGYEHTVALKNDGTVVVWGRNESGQAIVPAGLSAVKAIAAGRYHTVALKNDGTVVAWGNNDHGQTTIPVGLSGVTAIAACAHTVALRGDGTVVAWGRNVEGQSSVPAGLSAVTSIAAGGYHTIVLKSDGTVLAWGENGNGQRTVPTGLTAVTAIAAGANHSVAVTGAPLLSATKTGASLTLLWPDTSIGYRVESALSLSPPVTWSNEPGGLQTNSGSISITLPVSGSRKFYRLAKP